MALQIKVCGMKDADNICELAKLPIDYIGFIFYNQSQRNVEQMPEVEIPASIRKVGVFVNQTVTEIRKKIIEAGLQVVQLHGAESPEVCEQVRHMGVQVIKAFGIHKEFDWGKLTQYSTHVDYFLFDTKSKQHGGSGCTFDWEILEGYNLTTPYFLSGGLSTENIRSASLIADNRLIGLDLNSKFEITPGIKNIKELQKALNRIVYE